MVVCFVFLRNNEIPWTFWSYHVCTSLWALMCRSPWIKRQSHEQVTGTVHCATYLTQGGQASGDSICDRMLPRKTGAPQSAEQVCHATPDYTHFCKRQMRKPLSLASHSGNRTGSRAGTMCNHLSAEVGKTKIKEHLIPQQPKRQRRTNY